MSEWTKGFIIGWAVTLLIVLVTLIFYLLLK
jgi:hypothetical protein